MTAQEMSDIAARATSQIIMETHGDRKAAMLVAITALFSVGAVCELRREQVMQMLIDMGFDKAERFQS